MQLNFLINKYKENGDSLGSRELRSGALLYSICNRCEILKKDHLPEGNGTPKKFLKIQKDSNQSN